MKEKNAHLDEEPREDKAESRLARRKAPVSEQLSLNTREECLYV